MAPMEKKPQRRKRIPRVRKQAITLTQAAAARIQHLMGSQEGALGLRLGIKTRGCNGLTYTMDYCLEKEKYMEEVEQHGVKVIIAARSLRHHRYPLVMQR